MLKTCKTFDTVRESAAFMMGFRLGRKGSINARIDQEEPEAVLIDCNTMRAEEVYAGAILAYRQDVFAYGSLTPEEQYAYDCGLPDA